MRRPPKGPKTTIIQKKIATVRGWGQAIHFIRRKLDISQTEMGNEMGVCNTTVCRWECGYTTPQRMALVMLGQLLQKRGLALVLKKNRIEVWDGKKMLLAEAI